MIQRSEKPSEWYDKIYQDEVIGNSKAMILIHHWANRVTRHAVGAILDLGCGLGVLADKLRARYVGIDFSDFAIEHAIANTKNETAAFYVADIYEWSISALDDFTDTVVLSEVLEHLERPEDVIREAKRIARHRIVVTVPMNSPNPAHTKDKWSVRDLQRLIGPLSIIEDIRGFWLVVWEKNGRQTETIKKL